VLLQLATVARIPLKVTVLVALCESPNLYPEIVSEMNPSDGRKDVITGLLNGIPLLGRPDTVTMTLPVISPVGTVTTI
jgi:hypothetical protein